MPLVILPSTVCKGCYWHFSGRALVNFVFVVHANHRRDQIIEGGQEIFNEGGPGEDKERKFIGSGRLRSGPFKPALDYIRHQ